MSRWDFVLQTHHLLEKEHTSLHTYFESVYIVRFAVLYNVHVASCVVYSVNSTSQICAKWLSCLINLRTHNIIHWNHLNLVVFVQLWYHLCKSLCLSYSSKMKPICFITHLPNREDTMIFRLKKLLWNSFEISSYEWNGTSCRQWILLETLLTGIKTSYSYGVWKWAFCIALPGLLKLNSICLGFYYLNLLHILLISLYIIHLSYS